MSMRRWSLNLRIHYNFILILHPLISSHSINFCLLLALTSFYCYDIIFYDNRIYGIYGNTSLLRQTARCTITEMKKGCKEIKKTETEMNEVENSRNPPDTDHISIGTFVITSSIYQIDYKDSFICSDRSI